MSSLPDTPLLPGAQQLLDRLLPRIHSRLQEVDGVPVSVLLWGPGVNAGNPLTQLRADLRTELRRIGHAAAFSEELCDPKSSYSVRLQQLAQAQEFDLVVSTPCTPGSIGEIHDFIADRRVNAKVLVFLNRQHLAGYSAQSIEAISTVVSATIKYYQDDGDVAIIRNVTLSEIQRIREMKYILAGRY